MRRGLVTLVMLCLFATSAWAAKSKISILGLETVTPSGKPDLDGEVIARELTKGLRDSARIGIGPHQLAPADADLAVEKLRGNCKAEHLACMAQIGASLGADFLMYGRVEKVKDGYHVSIRLLSVARKQHVELFSEVMPGADTGGAKLHARARSIYRKLTGP